MAVRFSNGVAFSNGAFTYLERDEKVKEVRGVF